jgi:hypothetical protein
MSDRVKIMEQAIYLFVFLDDVLKSLGVHTDCRSKCRDSEILTTAFLSALHFGGNHADAIGFVKESGLMPDMVGESRFNRRWHQMGELTVEMFFQLGHVIKSLDETLCYRIDSFPVKSCHNIRIKRSRLFKGEAFRGKNASKREYFYGIKVFVITNYDNVPVEYAFTPGSWSEIAGLRQIPLDLPEGALLYGDSGFTDYRHEEELLDGHQVDFKVARKKNSKRPHEPWWNNLINVNRKPIETTFSQITTMFARKIHAVSQVGFLLKVVCFIFAFTLDRFIN